MRSQSTTIKRSLKIPFCIWVHPISHTQKHSNMILFLSHQLFEQELQIRNTAPGRTNDSRPISDSLTMSTYNNTWKHIKKYKIENIKDLDRLRRLIGLGDAL
jgi:hypothetical protein